MPVLAGISILSLLLFTVAGSSSFDRFKDALRGDNEDGSPNPFVVICASFLHFALVQLAAFLNGVLGSAVPRVQDYGVYGLLSLILFFYAVFCTIALAINFFQMVIWYNKAK